MPTRNDTLHDCLSQSDEINITVVGRKTGRPSTRPVWFVLEGDNLYLLPVKGSDTEWYKNVLKTPSMRVQAGDAQAELKATPVTDTTQVKTVVEKFREKYGTDEVKKYYSKIDVAVVAKMQ